MGKHRTGKESCIPEVSQGFFVVVFAFVFVLFLLFCLTCRSDHVIVAYPQQCLSFPLYLFEYGHDIIYFDNLVWKTCGVAGVLQLLRYPISPLPT